MQIGTHIKESEDTTTQTERRRMKNNGAIEDDSIIKVFSL